MTKSLCIIIFFTFAIVTLDSSSTENFNFGLVSNASNDSDSDESVNLFPTFNSLDDFFSPWIPDDVLPNFCSSLGNFHIATPNPLYKYSDFLFMCVLFSFLYISCFLKHHHHLPCYTSCLMQHTFFQSCFTILCLYTPRTCFYKIFLLLLWDHLLLNIHA